MKRTFKACFKPESDEVKIALKKSRRKKTISSNEQNESPVDWQYRMMIQNLASITQETRDCIKTTLSQLRRELRKHFGKRICVADECCRYLLVYEDLIDLCDELMDGYKLSRDYPLRIKKIEANCSRLAQRVQDIFTEYQKIFYRFSSGPEHPWPKRNHKARLLFKRLSEKPHYLQMNTIVVVSKFLNEFPKVKISGTEKLVKGLLYVTEYVCGYPIVDGDLYKRHVTDDSRNKTMLANSSGSTITGNSGDSQRSTRAELTVTDISQFSAHQPTDIRITHFQKKVPKGHIVF
ncbi:hypothetical protein ACOME3_006652 [Neoechinorhynchus agilis]